MKAGQAETAEIQSAALLSAARERNAIAPPLTPLVSSPVTATVASVCRTGLARYAAAMNLTYTESFRRYGAVLRNNVWSVAALSAKQELVLSMWQQQLRFDAQRKQLIYEDKLSDWLGNDMGRKELRGLLEQAQRDRLNVRMVIAHPIGETAQSQVGLVANESLIRKTFSVRPELQGQVVAFDGDHLRIEFSKAAA